MLTFNGSATGNAVAHAGGAAATRAKSTSAASCHQRGTLQRAAHLDSAMAHLRSRPCVGQHIGPPGQVQLAAIDAECRHERVRVVQRPFHGGAELELATECARQRGVAAQLQRARVARHVEIDARQRPRAAASDRIAEADDGIAYVEAARSAAARVRTACRVPAARSCRATECGLPRCGSGRSPAIEREASCSQPRIADRAPQIEPDAAALRGGEHVRAIRRAHDSLIEHELRPVEPQPRAQRLEFDRGCRCAR